MKAFFYTLPFKKKKGHFKRTIFLKQVVFVQNNWVLLASNLLPLCNEVTMLDLTPWRNFQRKFTLHWTLGILIGCFTSCDHFQPEEMLKFHHRVNWGWNYFIGLGPGLFDNLNFGFQLRPPLPRHASLRTLPTVVTTSLSEVTTTPRQAGKSARRPARPSLTAHTGWYFEFSGYSYLRWP